MNFSHVLHYLNLDESMSDTYVALLGIGTSSATQIAAKAKMQRTAVYSNLEKLVKQGLVLKKMSGKKTLYTPLSPERLNYIMRIRMEEVAKSVPLLNAFFQSGESFKPVTRFYEGIEGIREVHMEIVTHNIEKKFRVLQSPVILRDTIHDDMFLKHVTDVRIQNNIMQYSLRPFSAIEEVDILPQYLKGVGNEWMREIRYLPPTFAPHSIMYMWDDHVAIVSSKGENYALVVTSKDFTQTMKDMFDFMWNGSTKSTDIDE